MTNNGIWRKGGNMDIFNRWKNIQLLNPRQWQVDLRDKCPPCLNVPPLQGKIQFRPTFAVLICLCYIVVTFVVMIVYFVLFF